MQGLSYKLLSLGHLKQPVSAVCRLLSVLWAQWISHLVHRAPQHWGSPCAEPSASSLFSELYSPIGLRSRRNALPHILSFYKFALV